MKEAIKEFGFRPYLPIPGASPPRHDVRGINLSTG